MKTKEVFNVRYERYNAHLGFMETIDQKVTAMGLSDAEEIIRKHIPTTIDVVSIISIPRE